MSQKQRLFAALMLPKLVAQEISGLAFNLAKQTNGREVPESNLHITLKFYGEVDEAMSACIRDGLGRIQVDPFDLRFGSLKYRKSQGMIWAQFKQCPNSLFQLASEIESSGTNCGAASSEHSFIPHITLVRNVRRSLGRLPVLPANSVMIDNFALVRSQTSPEGSRYTVLENWPLRANK